MLFIFLYVIVGYNINIASKKNISSTYRNKFKYFFKFKNNREAFSLPIYMNKHYLSN
nr:MAG TPA: hypothetical protein [Caudoviricetes sp.]